MSEHIPGQKNQHTLSEDVERVVDLNVHVVANSRELVSFIRDPIHLVITNLPACCSILFEDTFDDDRVAIEVVLVGLGTLVLDLHGHRRGTIRPLVSGNRQRIPSG